MLVNINRVCYKCLMTDFIEIQWTCGSLDEARKVGRHLVSERLVASVNIIPWVESIYMWNNELETSQESKVILKAHKDSFDKIKEYILKNCTYEVPGITFSSIEGSNQEYLDWLTSETK